MKGLMLDPDAVSAYAQGSLRVGREVSRVADHDGDVLVPSLCLGLPLAQAAVETAARPLIPLLTASRGKVTEHLPKEWPIIDL